MKFLLLASLLFVSAHSMAATLVLKEGSGAGAQAMEVAIDSKLSYSKNSSTSFSGSWAEVEVSVGMSGFGEGIQIPGLNQKTKTVGNFQGSITVLSKDMVEIVVISDGAKNDFRLKASITRNANGDLASIKVTGKEFLQNANGLLGQSLGSNQLEQYKQLPGRLVFVVSDLNCRATDSGLACKQTMKLQLGM